MFSFSRSINTPLTNTTTKLELKENALVRFSNDRTACSIRLDDKIFKSLITKFTSQVLQLPTRLNVVFVTNAKLESFYSVNAAPGLFTNWQIKNIKNLGSLTRLKNSGLVICDSTVSSACLNELEKLNVPVWVVGNSFSNHKNFYFLNTTVQAVNSLLCSLQSSKSGFYAPRKLKRISYNEIKKKLRPRLNLFTKKQQKRLRIRKLAKSRLKKKLFLFLNVKNKQTQTKPRSTKKNKKNAL